ncbi:MAG: hypothetical protein AAF703_20595 [Cyanobacteria bacterium P01_D01_bin.105]
MTRTILASVVLAASALGAVAPMANAVEIRYSTLQVRQDEVVEIDSAIQRFQIGQRERVSR